MSAVVTFSALLACAAIVGCAPEPKSLSTTAGRAARARVRATDEPLVNEAAGRLGSGQIQRVVVAHKGEVSACYESEAHRDPTLQGAIVLSWEVLPDGSVVSPVLWRSSLASSPVEECVLRLVRGWRFPASESQTSVEEISFRFPM